jgi:hypothetical protein
VLELGAWEGMVYRIRLVDVDRLRLLVVSCFTKHAESSIQNQYELYHANMYNVKHFHVHTTRIIYLGMCMSMVCSYLSMVLLGNITILERISTYMYFTLAK